MYKQQAVANGPKLPFMMESKTQRTPRRLQLACEPCRIAKLKCDRNLPVCEQCFKRSRESICKYTEKGMRYNASVQTAGSMREKVHRLETLVNSLKAQQSNVDQRSPTEANKASGRQSIDTDGPPQIGKPKIEESRSTQWIGPTTWESVVEDVVDMQTYIEQEESREKFVANPSRATPIDNISGNNVFFPVSQSLSQAEILDIMPSRAEMDRFVAAWFNLMDPTRVIVHAPSFQTQYACFWEDPGHIDSAWFALLLATSSLGAEVSGQSLDDDAIMQRADHLRSLTVQALILANPVDARPWLVECLIIYITSLLFNHHDATSYVWQLMGLTIRLCYQAGYHRDPASNPRISLFECEMRRRVWMVACELDISISNTLGMVSLVNHRLCDTLPPSNLVETDFSHDHCAPIRPYEECTLVQVEICFSRLVWVLGNIMTMSQAVIPPSKTEIEAVGEQLDQARTELPAKLKLKPLDESFIDSPTEIVDRFRLEFAYQKARCVLYRRSLDEPGFEQERRWCLEAAQAIVQHSIGLLLAAQPGGQLALLRILLMRHVHDFTLAAMLICSQLSRGQWSDGSTRSKLLQACQLWDTPRLHSSKARIALAAISRCLNVQQAHGPAMQLPTPGEEFVSYLDFDVVPPTTTGTCISIGAYPNGCQSHSEDSHGDQGVVFDSMFDLHGSPFENVPTGWS